MSKRPFLIPFLVPAILVAVIFLAALAEILQYSFREFIPGSLDVGGFTLDNFARIYRPVYFKAVVNTFVLSLATAFFTLILSYPIAFALVRTKVEWVRTLLILLSITPLFTGEIVRTYAWMLVLGTNGFLNTMLLDIGIISEPVTFMYTRAGVVIALVQFAMPVMIIILATAISHINTDYEKAAANLGARPWTVITRVVIPLTMPGIISGFIVIFAWTMSAFATPQLIGGGKVLMISNAIYLQGFSALNFPFAATLSVIALISAFASLALMKLIANRLERQTAIH
ncbi:ABC transporter permease [Aestuariivirga sp. YIM B02566]|uniref:ABC transporter permease n=1 Tax=Taklimakanibacter albus TaxID=2800327 RepID=A0ACC5R5X7_9HYPH|nr:ABC transporter permease [Aestuariivirga sp. YIM B02566]MBK1868069.1 ABC transporter permease [Aestuariivirga sp. YIM B02566]